MIYSLLNAVLFTILGLVLFLVSFRFFDRVTPGNLWKEILEEHNTALAIIVGAVALGISMIVSAAIHG